MRLVKKIEAKLPPTAKNREVTIGVGLTGIVGGRMAGLTIKVLL